MSRHERAPTLDRVRTAAGLACASVPFAVLIHLFAEAVSLGRESIGAAFVLRHAYLVIVLVTTALVFGRTVGADCKPTERRRRCALIRAQFCSGSVVPFVAATTLFFVASQLAEGVPIASGDWCLGLAAAVAGSLVCALAVFVFGRSIIIAALAAITVLRDLAGPARCIDWTPHARAPRRASAAFTLFVPNRPPPAPSLV